MADEIERIERARLLELEKRLALEGPRVEPSVLIEAQELRAKYPDAPRAGVSRPHERRTLENDLIINTVAAALQRITRLEEQIGKQGRFRTSVQVATSILVLGALFLHDFPPISAPLAGAIILIVGCLALFGALIALNRM